MEVMHFLLVLVCAGTAFGFAGEYIPKSFYVIDQAGHKSDVVVFRSKRDVEMFPLLRPKRGGGSASASSHASASSSASSSSGGGTGGQPVYFGSDYPGYGQQPTPNNGGGGYGGGGQTQSFASASSSSSSGAPGGAGYGGGVGGTGYQGPILFSRFGEDTGSGIHVAGSAQGEKGAFSASSSSIDSDGKIKYSVQSGKY